MNEIEKLSIEWQCEKLCKQFAIYSDQNAFEELCDLFIEGGSYYRPSVPDVEIKSKQALLDAFLLRPPLVIRHLVLNCVINVLSDTSAEGYSYIIYLASPQNNEPLPLLAGAMQIGEFKDKYVKTNEGWKFVERKGTLALKTA